MSKTISKDILYREIKFMNEDFIKTNYSIREGCYVEFATLSKDRKIVRICGMVEKHWYNDKGGHNFLIEYNEGKLYRIHGYRLYKALYVHIPGKDSKKEKKKYDKNFRKVKKRRSRNHVFKKKEKKSNRLISEEI